MKRLNVKIIALIILIAFTLGGCRYSPLVVPSKSAGITASRFTGVSPKDIPEYTGNAYIEVNGNSPSFYKGDLTETAYESYSTPDRYGRCRWCVACLGKELMPTGERGDISSVTPSGWHSVQFDFIENGSLYNRCHLIGFQLTGENANENNLITGTRYMNVEGMLPFENEVAEYINETGNHVLYRVTPVFSANELVARGVQMEAYSVEDEGEGVCFNVFCYNVQPGVEIDYKTGNAKVE